MTNKSAQGVGHGIALLSLLAFCGCRDKPAEKKPNRAALGFLTETAIQANQVVYQDELHPPVDADVAFIHRQTLAEDLNAVDLTIAPTLRLRDAPTPLKVRGGAMAFRSDYEWKVDGEGYCTSIASIKRVEVSGDPHAPGAPKFIELTSSWSVTLAARNFNATTNANTGVIVSFPSTGCGGAGIQIKTIQNANSPPSAKYHYGFYNPNNGFDKLAEGPSPPGPRVRFRNDAGLCSQDEDACEHMSEVIVGVVTYKCPNGECEVRFHP